ncbi:hypothetical protein AMATHDRAFT_830 [Amanita thiersii Skay4041]|uniref:Uncharacterized protein n=1 Tax=Amanita thiersii Skay4041 TaxID=703135 RepID=A0A2A9P0J4_9AGAR|nr:hypothetical protein AMATHDRAFT_830 [Amanita thiersii Skay4041]
MALTQSARLPGPSWDEEVVPALRKRMFELLFQHAHLNKFPGLEDESRTLARRMSGMSLLSGDDHQQTFSSIANVTARAPPGHPTVYAQRRSEDTRQRNGYQPPDTLPEHVQVLSSSRPPATTSSKKSSTARSRTLSQPYTPGMTNGHSRPSTSRAVNGGSSRAQDTRPTRIPKSSRPSQIPSIQSTSPPTSHVNGFGQLANKVPTTMQDSHFDSYTSSRSTLSGLVRQTSGILDEPAPFHTGSMTSVSKSNYDVLVDEPPPRLSNDSDERPFEHWYRGDISRNGGVGELRVGRRQEMLDIANYGYSISKRHRDVNGRPIVTNIDSGLRSRKRADSVSEIRRVERDSLFLDDEHMRQIGRVLDENPPTDLDGEGEDSDVESANHYANVAQQRYNFTPSSTAGDLTTAHESPPMPVIESRSATPTPATVHMQGPSTRQPNGPSRTHARQASSPRPSDDSRSATPVQMKRGLSEPATRSAPSTPRGQRQQQQTTKATPASAQKRGASPMSPAKKTKSPPSKAARAKVVKPKREMTQEEKRRSVAAYPLSVGEGDMADAIPSWTQPRFKEGNWDEVVLPVVARKKGLEDHYEQADGSPQPKKVSITVEPAPGTFGFDHTKYRQPYDPENIPMDEFGRPIQQQVEEVAPPQQEKPRKTADDEPPQPLYHPEPPPSPVPFADYAPNKTIQVPMVVGTPASQVGKIQASLQMEEKDDSGAGCCKCVIM